MRRAIQLDGEIEAEPATTEPADTMSINKLMNQLDMIQPVPWSRQYYDQNWWIYNRPGSDNSTWTVTTSTTSGDYLLNNIIA